MDSGHIYRGDFEELITIDYVSIGNAFQSALHNKMCSGI